MKTLIIDIYKPDVLNEVIKTTAYVGAKQSGEDTDIYNRVFLSDAETEILERGWNEACADLAVSLHTWLGEVDATSGVATISVADTFNFALTDALKQAMNSFMITTLLAKWYMIVNPALAESSMLESVMYRNKIKEIMNIRTMPVRRRQSPF